MLVNRLSKAAFLFSEFDVVFEDFLTLSSYFSSFVWSYVKRDGNCVAHNLARLVPIKTKIHLARLVLFRVK